MAFIKTTLPSVTALLLMSLFELQIPEVHGQGALTPPGAPAPTMKSLDQIEPRTLISSVPYTITNSGSYYLASNLTGVLANNNGITVVTNNVVIDLRGFALTGASTNTFSGIYVAGSWTNVTVRNGSLSGWGASGIDAYSYGPPANLIFEHLMSANNAHYGLGIGNGSIVQDCVCQNNGWGGIAAVGPSTISGCTLVKNTNAGAYGLGVFGECLVRNCEIFGNYYGVFSYNSRMEMHDCQSTTNLYDGVFVYYSSTPTNIPLCTTSFHNCSFIANGRYGIYASGQAFTVGPPILVSGCHVVGNVQNGISLSDCPGSKVSDCNAIGNGGSGIYISGDGSKIVGNNAQGNNVSSNSSYAGISIFANNCLVEDNHVSENGNAGLFVAVGSNNIVVKNTIADSYIFYSVNDVGPIGSAASATSPWANIYH